MFTCFIASIRLFFVHFLNLFNKKNVVPPGRFKAVNLSIVSNRLENPHSRNKRALWGLLRISFVCLKIFYFDWWSARTLKQTNGAYNMLKKDTHSLLKKEVKDKINTAKNCYVYCVLDGVDVGHYFKTIKSSYPLFRSVLKRFSSVDQHFLLKIDMYVLHTRQLLVLR